MKNSVLRWPYLKSYLFNCRCLPSFKELLDVANPGITNSGFSTMVAVNESSPSTLISGTATKR